MSTTSSHEEFLRKKRKRRIVRWTAVLLLAVAVVTLFAYTAHRPQIRISQVELTGETIVSPTDVSSATLSYLKGSFLWLFPKNNSFLYSNSGLSKYLKNNFQRIDTIDIHLKNFHTLAITITERKPTALWCDTLPAIKVGTTTPSQTLSEKCYFMDSQSTIFSDAPNFSGNAYFKYYGLVSVVAPIGTQYIASTTEFSDIANFIETAKQLSLAPVYLIGKDNNEFSLVLASGGQIYFDMKQPIAKTESNLSALLREPALSQNILKLDYIDLRFGNNLYYKLK